MPSIVSFLYHCVYFNFLYTICLSPRGSSARSKARLRNITQYIRHLSKLKRSSLAPYMIWPSSFGDKNYLEFSHSTLALPSSVVFSLGTYFHHSLFAPRSRRASDSDPYLWPSDGAVYAPDTPGSQNCIRISGEGPGLDIPATVTRSCASGRTGGILCQLC